MDKNFGKEKKEHEQKSGRKRMYEERIHNELSMILRREIRNPHLQFVSLTKVELSQDFSRAEVYWDTFESGKRGDIKKAFETAQGKLRSSLAHTLKTRHTPELHFLYDGQFDGERAIDEILNEEAKKGKVF